MKRLFILLISLFALQAQAALNLLFRGDLESGSLKTPGSGGVVDYFYQGSSTLPDLSGNCTAGNNNVTKYPATRIVTSPAIGNYAVGATLYWGCDYRPVNSGGFQKPRAAIQATHSNVYQTIGKTYWYTFAIYLPNDWISETSSSMDVNLWQSHKSSPRTMPSLVNIDEGQETMKLSITDRTSGGTFSTAASDVYTWATNRGEWNRFLVHFKPCYTTNLNDTACGFLRVYHSNTARRTAGTALTAVYSGTGKNMESATSTIIDLAGNLYKYNWHCKQTGNSPVYTGTESDPRKDYAYCMQEPPPSQTVTYVGGTAAPITAYFDNINIAEDTGSATISEVIALLDPDFNAGTTQTPSLPTITKMNADKPLDVNDYSYWTSNGSTLGAWGLYLGSITDGVNTENMAAVASNANGGCVTLGGMSTLSGGPVTVSMTYDAPYFAAHRGISGTDKEFAEWTVFNVADPATTAFDSGDPCFNRTGAVTVQNTTTSNGLLNMPTAYGIDDQVAGDKITSMFQVMPGVLGAGGVNDQARLRVSCTSGNVDIVGTLGTFDGAAPTTTGTGTDHVIREKVSRGNHFVEIEFTANNAGADNCVLKAGPNHSGPQAGDGIRLIDAMMWKNRTPHVMTYQTSLNKPDTIAPVITDCAFTGNADGTGNVGCTVSEASTVYTVVTTSTTEPTDTQVIAGQNDAGTQAMWSGSVQGSAGVLNRGTALLDSNVDKYAYFVAVDSTGLKSQVTAAEAPVLATLVGTKKLKLGTATDKIRVRNAFGIMSDATVILDRVYIYDTDISSITTPTPVEPLVILQDVQITNGVGDATEARVVPGSGSLNALSDGSYWVLSVEGTGANMKISYGQKSVVTE